MTGRAACHEGGMWKRQRWAMALGFGLVLGAATGCAPVEDVDPVARPSAAGGETDATSGSGGGGAAGGGEHRGTGGADGSGGAPQTGGVATMMTWNLENFPLTSQTPGLVLQAFEELQPDLVAVEEIADVGAFEALIASLDGYAGILNDDPGAFQRVGLVYRTDRVSVDDVATLFPDDWYAFPRPPLLARVTVAGDPPIDFYTVVLHLKAQLDDASANRRRAACAALDGWIRDQMEATGERDIVLLGDMNDKLTDPEGANVFQVFLDEPDQVRFLTLPAAEAGEYSYIPFEGMIDHVLVTTDMLDEVGTGQTEVLHLDETIADYDALSDHRPVRTWLRWGGD